MATLMSNYDERTFTSRPSPERHPERMFIVASLLGLKPQHPSKCRVLELGSSTGDLLAPLAVQYPQSQFTGVDSSAHQCRQAETMSQNLSRISQTTPMQESITCGLGLSNLSFLQADLCDLKLEAQSYDYIVCHGLYSWVSEDVRQAIWRLSKHALKDTGILLLSSNCWPGSYWRELITKLVRAFDDSRRGVSERVAAARSLMGQLYKQAMELQTPHSLMIVREVERLSAESDALVLHELLNPFSTSFSVRELIASAGEHGFAYAGDTRLSRVRGWLGLEALGNLFGGLDSSPGHKHPSPPSSNPLLPQSLGQGSTDLSHLGLGEFYMDVLSPGNFRELLFVPQSQYVDWGRMANPDDYDILGSCFFSSALVRVDSEDFGHPPQFCDAQGRRYTAPSSLIAVALDILAEVWPANISFSELQTQTEERCGTRDIAPVLLRSLKELTLQNAIDVRTETLSIARHLSAKPCVWSVAREQARRLGWATNLRYEYQEFGVGVGELISAIDGSRTRSDLELLADRRFQEVRRGGGQPPVMESQEFIHSLLEFLLETAFLVK